MIFFMSEINTRIIYLYMFGVGSDVNYTLLKALAAKGDVFARI